MCSNRKSRSNISLNTCNIKNVGFRLVIYKKFFVLSFIYSKQPILDLTQVWSRELSFSRLECGVQDRLHIYPMCGILYFPRHKHQIDWTISVVSHPKETGNVGAPTTEQPRPTRDTVSNVESQIFTPNITCLIRGSNPERRRAKRIC